MGAIQINIFAVLVAVVANFILGYLWFSVLFGKAWAREMGFSDSDVKPTGGEMARGMIIMLGGNFLMAFVFANNMAAWSFVPGMKEMPALGTILNATAFTWLGFYLPMDIGRVAWEKKSWKLFSITTSYHFIMLLIAAVILTLM